MTIRIDEELKNLLPPLSDEAYGRLENEVIADGCRDALVIWNNILVDGHNRYNICTKHNIKFNTTNREFESREHVKIWMIANQDSRRNLTSEQAVYYRGMRYELEKGIQGGDKKSNRQNDGLISKENQTTAERLAKEYNVAPRTIERDAIVARTINQIGEASPEAKQKILSGKANINKKDLEKLSHKSPEIIKSVAIEIGNGTYVKQKQESNEVMQVCATNKTESSNVGRYSFIMGGVGTLSDTIKMVSEDIKKHLTEITIISEREQIRSRIQEQINELENLLNLF